MKETAARRPNRFLADLTQAMRVTAEQARQATIEQFQADAKAYVEQLRARSADESVELRNHAESDTTAIRDWSKAEMERIRVETDQRIARRKELLEQELQDYAGGIDIQVERVEKQVSAFEEEMSQFMELLLQEADPTVFASMAAQMPEPPELTEPNRDSLSAELRARRDELMRSEGLPVPPRTPQGNNGSKPDEEAPAPAPEEPDLVPEPVGRESTQVVVVGLVSVASIATFKRQLGRLPGVKNVGVSSGPDGEFIFTVGHTPETNLATLVPTLPNFQARVVSEQDTVLNVSAHDPEAEG